jgi:hypothetical protein
MEESFLVQCSVLAAAGSGFQHPSLHVEYGGSETMPIGKKLTHEREREIGFHDPQLPDQSALEKWMMHALLSRVGQDHRYVAMQYMVSKWPLFRLAVL